MSSLPSEAFAPVTPLARAQEQRDPPQLSDSPLIVVNNNISRTQDTKDHTRKDHANFSSASLPASISEQSGLSEGFVAGQRVTKKVLYASSGAQRVTLLHESSLPLPASEDTNSASYIVLDESTPLGSTIMAPSAAPVVKSGSTYMGTNFSSNRPDGLDKADGSSTKVNMELLLDFRAKLLGEDISSSVSNPTQGSEPLTFFTTRRQQSALEDSVKVDSSLDHTMPHCFKYKVMSVNQAAKERSRPTTLTANASHKPWVRRNPLSEHTAQLGNNPNASNPVYYVVTICDYPYVLAATYTSAHALLSMNEPLPMTLCVTIRDLVETCFEHDRTKLRYKDFISNWDKSVCGYSEDFAHFTSDFGVKIMDMLGFLSFMPYNIEPDSDHLIDAVDHLEWTVVVQQQELQKKSIKDIEISKHILKIRKVALDARTAEDEAKNQLLPLIADKATLLAEVNTWKTREGALRRANASLIQRQASHDQELLEVRQDFRANKDQQIREKAEVNKETDALKDNITEVTKALSDTRLEYDIFKLKTTEREEKAEYNWQQRKSEWKAAKKGRDTLKKEVTELRAWNTQHSTAIPIGKGQEDLIQQIAELQAGEDEHAKAMSQVLKEREETEKINDNLRSQLLAEEKKRKNAEALLENSEVSLKIALDNLKTTAQNEKKVVEIAVADALRKQEANLALLPRNGGQDVDEAVAAALQKQKEDFQEVTQHKRQLFDKALADALVSQQAEIERLKEHAEQSYQNHQAEMMNLHAIHEEALASLDLASQKIVDSAKADIAQLKTELHKATSAIGRMRGICNGFAGRGD